MKVSTIKSVLHRKTDQYLESIEDKELRCRMTSSIIVAGGSIASMLLQEPVNDFDIYFSDPAVAIDVATYYLKRTPGFTDHVATEYLDGCHIHQKGSFTTSVLLKPEQITDVDPDVETVTVDAALPEPTKEAVPAAKRYKVVCITDNAITLTDKIQLILRFCGTPEEIILNFDFVHCTNYWESANKQLTLSKNAMSSLLTKELHYVGSKFPLCSVLRTRKFIKRGWTCAAGPMLKMLVQLQGFDLTKMQVLREQLIGVDTAYFFRLIALLEKTVAPKVTEDGQTSEQVELTGALICEMIDKLYES